MDFNFILPLEQQALVKIADTLWNSQCMKELVLSCDSDDDEDSEKENDAGEEVDKIMRNEIFGKISNLCLPETIKSKLVWIARNVGLQKINYYFHHKDSWSILKLPHAYHWTSRGRIDKKKTAESLINDGTIDVCNRLSLACYYCFEKKIRELSGKLSPPEIKSVLDDGDEVNTFWYRTININRRKRKYEQSIKAETEEESWLRVVQGYDRKIYSEVYTRSLHFDNSVAAEYFFKLDWAGYSLEDSQGCNYYTLRSMLEDYRNVYDDPTPPTEHFRDMVVFLLKQVTKGQQLEALAQDPQLTLELFLEWPFEHLFFETAEFFCPHASAQNLNDLLCHVLKRIKDTHKGSDYREVFRRFWCILPVSQKTDVINYSMRSSSSLFDDLLEVGYLEGISLIFGDATSTQKQDFIHSDVGERVCEAFVLRKEWQLLKLFIDMCLPSPILNLNFKNGIKRYLPEGEINDIFKILNVAEDAGN